MSDEEAVNPCQYKRQCRNCNIVSVSDRPGMCESIKCQHYTICPGCHKNKTLIGNLCKSCFDKKNGYKAVEEAVNQRKEKGTATLQASGGEVVRRITITPPGVAPKELTQPEIEYYEARWNDYKGYYRNPAAYFVCHMIIIEEINLSYINGEVLSARGSLSASLLKEKNISIRTLKTLKDQLPEKEAQDVMDDEKSMAYIYEEYCVQNKNRNIKGVRRIFSNEAIALAPHITFPIDPKFLLERLGYKTEEVEDVLLDLEPDFNPAEHTAEEVLNFFGFRLKEKYAMPYNIDEIKHEQALNGDDG